MVKSDDVEDLSQRKDSAIVVASLKEVEDESLMKMDKQQRPMVKQETFVISDLVAESTEYEVDGQRYTTCKYQQKYL